MRAYVRDRQSDARDTDSGPDNVVGGDPRDPRISDRKVHGELDKREVRD